MHSGHYWARPGIRQCAERFFDGGGFEETFLMQQKLLKETLSCVNRVLGKCAQLSTAAREKPEKTEGEKDKKKVECSADMLEKVADKTEIKRKVKSR